MIFRNLNKNCYGFMCRLIACKVAWAFQSLYDPVVAKGKSKELLVIWETNQLLKQAFILAQYGIHLILILIIMFIHDSA